MARRSNRCYLCGEPGARTRDHVFARSMFPEAPEPSITAPAHQTCNLGYAADEEIFRAFAVSGLANEAARTLWDGPIRRSFRHSPPFGRMFASKISMREIRSASGLYLGSLPTITPDGPRIERVLRKHVRGLAWHHLREYMPQDADFRVHQVMGDPSMEQLSDQVVEFIHDLPPAQVLGETVLYRWGQAADRPQVSSWLLVFFQRTGFLVFAGPAGAFDPQLGSDLGANRAD